MKKSERISILEKEVAELKLIVAKLRKPSNLVKEELVKSNNELRAEVIENAKSFIKYHENENWEFVISEKLHRVVTFNLKLKDNNIGIYENDLKVFNEHIGKAIALGRALNLDVSEFETCVQPDNVVIGQIVQPKSEIDKNIICKVLKFDNCNKSNYGGKSFRHTHDEGWLCDSKVNILDDTNAIYEVK